GNSTLCGLLMATSRPSTVRISCATFAGMRVFFHDPPDVNLPGGEGTAHASLDGWAGTADTCCPRLAWRCRMRAVIRPIAALLFLALATPALAQEKAADIEDEIEQS